MATPSDAYDTMKLSELLDECADRGIEAGALKGNALRDVLRRDDANFLRAPLPAPQPPATGLPPMAAATAAAAAVRRAWGDSADSIAVALRIRNADAAEREVAMAALAERERAAAARPKRPATAMERSTLALQRHVAASAATAEAVPTLTHPSWIEAARADRAAKLAVERQAEAAPKAWSRGARAEDEQGDAPTQDELSALPVPVNPTRLRIMMGQDVDIVLRNPNAQLAPPPPKDAARSGRGGAAAQAAASQASQAAAAAAAQAAAVTAATAASTMEPGSGLDAAASTASTLPAFVATAPAPAEAGAGLGAQQTRPGSAASLAQSQRPGSARGSLRPGSAAAATQAALAQPRSQAADGLMRMHEYSVEHAAAAATAGLRAEELAAVRAANAARGVGDYTTGFDAAAFAGSFTLVSAAQRKAARRAGLLTPAHGATQGSAGGGGGGGGAAGARSLAASRPSSARPSSAAGAGAQQLLAAPAATDRLGRPGSALATSGGEAGEYLVNAPRHVRYVADLRRQVAEVGAEVRAAREELLARVAVLLDPKWRPPQPPVVKPGASSGGGSGGGKSAE